VGVRGNEGSSVPEATGEVGRVPSRYHAAVELIGRRWTGAILFALVTGPRYFRELKAAVPGISDRLLSQRLRELEAEGIVDREVHPGSPARVSYCLSKEGRGGGVESRESRR
jgi:DNA-binding HxlR family transcriptional regulator